MNGLLVGDKRYWFGGLLVWMALGVLAAYLAGERERNAALKELNAQLESAAELRVQALSRQILRRQSDVQFLAETPAMQNLISILSPIDRMTSNTTEAADAKRRLTEMFLSYARLNPDVRKVRLLSLQERAMELVRVNSSGNGASAVSPEWLQDKTESSYLTELRQFAPGELYASEIELNREYGKIERPTWSTLRIGTSLGGD